MHDFDPRDFQPVTRLFPLPGVVMFPHVVLPLHIFEPRYRQMTQDALASDKLITIVQVRPQGTVTEYGEPELETVGCLGRILNHERLPDGRFNFLLLGLKRVRLIRELEVSTLYRQAEIEILEDEISEEPDEPRRSEMTRLFRSLHPPDPDLADLLNRDLPLGVLSDILTHALGLPPSMKQAFLEESNVDRRARAFTQLLRQLTSRVDRASRGPHPFPPPFSLN